MSCNGTVAYGDDSQRRAKQNETLSEAGVPPWFEKELLAEPSHTWPEAAARAQYLIRRYADTAEAQDPRRQRLIKRALSDLARLIEHEREEP